MKRGREEEDEFERFLEACGKYGDVKQVQDFIERGIDVNAVDRWIDGTALHKAARCGRVDVVKYCFRTVRIWMLSADQNVPRFTVQLHMDMLRLQKC